MAERARTEADVRLPRIDRPARRGTTWALVALVAVVAGGGGVTHLATPSAFTAMVPAALPALALLYATGVVQLVIGIAALLPRTRHLAGLAFAALLAAYLPLHLWDYWRPDPVFAPPVATTVRVVVQLLFITGGLALWRRRATPRPAAPLHSARLDIDR
jgi:uncharacterized membrane protein